MWNSLVFYKFLLKYFLSIKILNTVAYFLLHYHSSLRRFSINKHFFNRGSCHGGPWILFHTYFHTKQLCILHFRIKQHKFLWSFLRGISVFSKRCLFWFFFYLCVFSHESLTIFVIYFKRIIINLLKTHSFSNARLFISTCGCKLIVSLR